MSPEPVTLTHVRVLTMDPTLPNAAGVTLVGGRVVALGGAAHGGATVDCGGGILVPGFVDPHVHLLAAAAAAVSLDCSPRSGVRSIADLQWRLAEYRRASPEGWLRAVGYDETRLSEERHPTRWELDAAVPGQPVRLLHRGGHAALLNSRALALAGITVESEEPPGGVIDRRLDDGEPNGLLIDMDDALAKVVPPMSEAALARGLAQVERALLAAGVVAVQDMTPSTADARALLRRLTARFVPSLLPPAAAPGCAGDGPVKLMLGEVGGLSARGQRSLQTTVVETHRQGRQVAIHATTVDGLRAALDAIALALASEPRTDPRHRIEHASICPPEFVERAASLGVVIVGNPGFLVESAARYRRTVDTAYLTHLYNVGALLRAGVRVAAASDAPYAAPSPLAAIAGAMRRRGEDGTPLPGERLSAGDALALVTREAAFAARAEDRHGLIAPGRAADLVLLDRMPAPDAPDARVWWTLRDGQIAYRAADAPPFRPRHDPGGGPP